MLKPFFPFYGSKWRSAKIYGAPKFDRVVEPFAGSAGYSTFFEPARVVLCDIDEIIVGVWLYLIAASSKEILALPDLEPEQSTEDLKVSQEARWFIGFWLNRGSASPKKTQTAFSRRTERGQLVWGQRARERVAAQVDRIRHWSVVLGSYDSLPNNRATWFVDPPYVKKGKYYRRRFSAFPDLAAWSKTRAGEVMVCENAGADWLPFTPLASIKATSGRSAEVLWRQP